MAGANDSWGLTALLQFDDRFSFPTKITSFTRTKVAFRLLQYIKEIFLIPDELMNTAFFCQKPKAAGQQYRKQCSVALIFTSVLCRSVVACCPQSAVTTG